MSYDNNFVMANIQHTIQKNWNRLSFLLIITCFFTFSCVLGQKNEQNDNFELSDNILLYIEEYLESSDEDASIDVLDLYEYLQDIYENRLDINDLTISELNRLRLLSDVQINNFILYRQNYGPFISIYEIQSIPLFDLETINRILPFVTINESDDKYAFKPLHILKGADHELIIRSQRNLETLAGSIKENGFLGDPYRHFLRFRTSNGPNFKFGILAEKDIGEQFFSGSNKAGFDFYSYYLSLRDINRSIKHVVLGDYTVSMGQGLIVHNQFGGGLSSFTTNIKKGSGAFRQYTSRNEVNYFKGTGIEIGLNEYFTANAFASQNKVDGTLKDVDDNGILDAFSSLDISGNHRSENELLKKNKIQRTSIGGIIKYERNASRLAINVLTENFDKPYDRTLRPDNIFFPRQNRYTNISLDYGHIWRSVNLFGESAYSANGGFAHLFGALLSMDPKLDLSVVYRNYSRDYAAITPNSFGQGSSTQNEKGMYIGMEMRPSRSIIINAYADHWSNPWLKFLVDSPGVGSDYLLKVTYFKKRKHNAYVLFKTEKKPRNSGTETPIDFTVPERVSKIRLHFGNKVSQSIDLRNRIEFSQFKNDNEIFSGIMIYQDVIYRSLENPLSFSGRFMWFNIDDFDSRIYAYENDVLSDFSIPFFSGNGIRYYVNLRYRLRRATMELRWAQTRYSNRDVISSGLTQIDGSVVTGVKAQVRWKF